MTCSRLTIVRYLTKLSTIANTGPCTTKIALGSVGRLVAFHLGNNGAHRLRLIGNAGNRLALAALKAVGGELC